MGETARGFHATTTTTKFKCGHRAPPPCFSLHEALGSTELQETELTHAGPGRDPWCLLTGAAAHPAPSASAALILMPGTLLFTPVAVRVLAQEASLNACSRQIGMEPWGPCATHGFRKWAQDPRGEFFLSTVVPMTKRNRCPVLPRGEVPESSCAPPGVPKTRHTAFSVPCFPGRSWAVRILEGRGLQRSRGWALNGRWGLRESWSLLRLSVPLCRVAGHPSGPSPGPERDPMGTGAPEAAA